MIRAESKSGFMSRPAGSPIVYLDTADFSRFADVLVGRTDPKASAVWSYLLPLVDAGTIRIPVSMPLISEALQYQGGGRELTLRKAAAMERLCGQHAFRYFGDVVENEFIDLAYQWKLLKHKPRAEAAMPLSDEYQWYPSLDNTVYSMSESIKEQIAIKAKQQKLNRHGVRTLQSEFPKLLRRSDTAFALLSSMPNQDFRDWPGLEGVIRSGTFARAATGIAKPKELERAIFGVIAKPENFVKYYFERYEGDKTMPSWMKGFGTKIFESVGKLLDDLRRHRAPFGSPEIVSVLESTSNKMVCDVAVKMLEISSPKLRKLGLGERELDTLRGELSLKATPTARLYGQLFKIYMANFIRHERHSPEPKPSDGGDIIHALYIPHCHIWRGDKRSGELYSPVAEQYETISVRKLEDLPSAIDAILGQSQQAD